MRPSQGGIFEIKRQCQEKSITTDTFLDNLRKSLQFSLWKSYRSYGDLSILGTFRVVNKLWTKMLTGQAEIFLCCPEREIPSFLLVHIFIYWTAPAFMSILISKGVLLLYNSMFFLLRINAWNRCGTRLSSKVCDGAYCKPNHASNKFLILSLGTYRLIGSPFLIRLLNIHWINSDKAYSSSGTVIFFWRKNASIPGFKYLSIRYARLYRSLNCSVALLLHGTNEGVLPSRLTIYPGGLILSECPL